jgi:hypothetical protein
MLYNERIMMSFYNRVFYMTRKKGAEIALVVGICSQYVVTSFRCTTQHEVPASLAQLVSAPPQAFHRTCPALGLSTKLKYNISRRRANAYILALKYEVLRK